MWAFYRSLPPGGVPLSLFFSVQMQKRVVILPRFMRKGLVCDSIGVRSAAAQLLLNFSAAEIERGNNFTEDSLFLSNLLIHKGRGATSGSVVSPPPPLLQPQAVPTTTVVSQQASTELSEAEHLGPRRGADMKYQISSLAPNWAL